MNTHYPFISPFNWLLCSFAISLSVAEHFLTLTRYARFIIYFSRLRNHFSKELWLLFMGNGIQTKIWALVMLIATGVSPQRGSVYMCVHAYTCVSTCHNFISTFHELLLQFQYTGSILIFLLSIFVIPPTVRHWLVLSSVHFLIFQS